MRERRMGDAVRLQYDADLPADAPGHPGRRAGARARRPLRGRPASPPSPTSSSSTTRWTCRGSRTSRCLRARSPPSRASPRSGAPSARRDVLAHHPYQSFDAVTRFVSDAASDPRVLAIKMTLYRVSPTSPIAQALHPRGRERQGGRGARRAAGALRRGGQHPLGARPGGGRAPTSSTGCPATRPTARRAWWYAQEPDGIRRYCHLATGNYNVRTGGIYSDFSLFTCRESIGEDVTELFNMLTGYTRPAPLPPPADGPHRHARRLPAAHPPRGRARPPGRAGAHRGQDEQPGGPHHDRGAVRREPGRGADRPDRARDLLPPARGARASRTTSG